MQPAFGSRAEQVENEVNRYRVTAGLPARETRYLPRSIGITFEPPSSDALLVLAIAAAIFPATVAAAALTGSDARCA
jgi:hypothetical protein